MFSLYVESVNNACLARDAMEVTCSECAWTGNPNWWSYTKIVFASDKKII